MKRKTKSMGALVLVLFMLVSVIGGTGFALDATQDAGFETAEAAAVRALTEDFFEKKQQNFVSEKEISLAEFYAPAVRNTLAEKTSSKLFQFEKIVRQSIDADVSRENFEVTINKVKVDGNTAAVTAYENYTYILDSAEDGIVSSRGITYNISLSKHENEWKIDRIKTNNELEGLVEGVADVTTLFVADSAVTPVADPTIEAEHIRAEEQKRQNESQSARGVISRTFHWYSGVQALTYALEYSNSSHSNYDTEPYNDLFDQHNPKDCQNFVSQCVWAGLYGTNTAAAIEAKSLPMIKTAGREWWSTSSEACSNGTWTSIGSFKSYIEDGGADKDGLVGATGKAGSMANGCAGDMVHIRDSDGVWYHTYIIVQATGTSGSRTNANYYVCAHSANRRNETLQSILGAGQSNLRLLTISGSYY
ncbi:amidase domain-containing protein [uncultured Dysosmobacter sp.]|uniref:amidase domain-containing protein n=1 Tax=uncultured Dysosmobacter sp. TaxID=2591384 RepID=UPI002611ABD3|nr:amidase domain-containing protein [uncultured Dysosmobacter sp.]